MPILSVSILLSLCHTHVPKMTVGARILTLASGIAVLCLLSHTCLPSGFSEVGCETHSWKDAWATHSFEAQFLRTVPSPRRGFM